LNIDHSRRHRQNESVTFDTELQLESGRLLGPITLAYETYGRLNAAATTSSWSVMPGPAMPTPPAAIIPRTASPAGGTT
jgi:hypothetical protein